MSKLLRYFEPGQCCFITSVAARRNPILVEQAGLLCRAVRNAKHDSRFDIIAWVILPDHFHALLRCPHGDFSTLVQRVKLSFALQRRHRFGVDGATWQHRYWDHIIRSEADMSRHIDYIHRNPVKHGFVDSPGKWRLSSYQRFRRLGYYDPEWGAIGMGDEDGDFGE